MGRDTHEREARGEKQVRQRSKRRTGSSYYTYHPTVAHKKDIREACHDSTGQVDALIQVLARGVTIKLRFREDFGAFEAQARKGEGDWRDIPTVNAYHAGADVAIATLLYFLVTVYPEWPENGPEATQSDFDW